MDPTSYSWCQGKNDGAIASLDPANKRRYALRQSFEGGNQAGQLLYRQVPQAVYVARDKRPTDMFLEDRAHRQFRDSSDSNCSSEGVARTDFIGTAGSFNDELFFSKVFS
jgi:hypothetical protein